MLFQFRLNLLQGPTNNLIGSAGKRRSYAAARELPSVSEVDCARLSSSSPEGERIDPEGASSESPVPHQPSGTHVQRIEVSELSARKLEESETVRVATKQSFHLPMLHVLFAFSGKG